MIGSAVREPPPYSGATHAALSSNLESIKKRYEERYDLYVESADVIIDADDTPINIAKKITGAFYK